MNARFLLFLLPLLLCLLPSMVQAQDLIYLKNGKILDVHIKSVNGGHINYSATKDGPKRFLSSSKAEKIVYERGRVQIFKERANKETLADAHNVLTLSPVNILVFGKAAGLGLGLCYERFIGQRHLVSVQVPFYLGLATDGTQDKIDRNLPHQVLETYYTAPGIRFHWLKPESRADFASGISVLFGNMNTVDSYVGNSTTAAPDFNPQNYLLTAITLDNDFTLYTKRKIAFGLHTAFGPVVGEYGMDGKWMVQIGLKLGRKF